jgi:soluble lytic murein transglycosylase-like protein
MAYLIDGRFRVPAAFAVLPVFALVQFVLAAPASARVHSYSHAYHHHYLARREAAPAPTDNFAQSTFGGRQDRQSPPSFNEQDRQSQPSFNESASPIDGMAASAASTAGIPVSLVERVIKRESGGNPRAVSQGNYGLMQIRLGTARAMGYSGSAEGLLDAQTNMTYAVKYLAGAYRASGGNESRAVALYASGYYAQAKAQGFSPYQTAQANTSQPGFDSYREEAAAPRYIQTKYQTKSQDRFDQTQYDQSRYQQVRYDRAPRSRYVEAGYNSGPFVAAAHPQFSETQGDSGWQPGLYAYAPAHPLHYRVRHYRHHAV